MLQCLKSFSIRIELPAYEYFKVLAFGLLNAFRVWTKMAYKYISYLKYCTKECQKSL